MWILGKGLVDLGLILNFQSSKFGVEVAGHLEFDAADFAIVFSVDFEGALEMVEGVTAGEVDTEIGKVLLGFEELGDVEVDFTEFLDFDSEVFFHVEEVLFEIGDWALDLN
jgi:hypothetical protein